MKKEIKIPYSRRGRQEKIPYDISGLEGRNPGEIIPRIQNPKKHNPKLEKEFDYEHASLIVSRTDYVFGYESRQDRERVYWELFKDPSSLIKFRGNNFAILIRTPLKLQSFYHTVVIQDFHSPEEAYQVALKVAQYMIRCLRFFFRWDSPFTISDFVAVNIKNKITRFYWAQVYRSKICRH